jgi:hypothetical protein
MVQCVNSYRSLQQIYLPKAILFGFLKPSSLVILMSVSHPTFVQPVRRNLLAPVLLAFLVLGIVIALLIRFTPMTTASVAITRTAVYPVHTVFKSDSIVVGQDTSQDDLYVLTTLHIDDNLHLPLFLKDFTATLTTGDGQQINTSAVEEHDLPNIFTSFPALKPLASEPLLRETMINPGAKAQGMILLHFPVTQSIWDHRQNAVLHIDYYHQGQQDVTISRASEATKAPANPPSPTSAE